MLHESEDVVNLHGKRKRGFRERLSATLQREPNLDDACFVHKLHALLHRAPLLLQHHTQRLCRKRYVDALENKSRAFELTYAPIGISGP